MPPTPVNATAGKLNADILANFKSYGADDVVDFDRAVRSSPDENNIDNGYLTFGAPNAAYHNKIAQTLADAASKFPPEARL